MKITLANTNHIPEVVSFFNANLDRNCPINSSLNQYYEKAGWHLQDQNEEFNVWCLYRTWKD